MNTKLPIIKETRLEKIEACLRCISENSFDRNRQKNCILKLYPGKNEKSVFRGMVIPSLRHLGLILGHAGQLRISANGLLIIESENISTELHLRCISAVIYEIDRWKFGLLDYLDNNIKIELKEVVEHLGSKNSKLNINQIKERVISWLSILSQSRLIEYVEGNISINNETIDKVNDDIDKSKLKVNYFKPILFEEYRKLARRFAGVVDITELRAAVASSALKDNKIITEELFDFALGNIPFISKEYLITLGRTMGAEEKLFKNKGSYYRTINIRMLKG